MAASIKAAAAMLGCSEAQLKDAKARGSKGFRSNGSVCIPEVAEWLKENPQQGADDKKKLECRRLVAQCEKLEHELALARRDALTKIEVNECLAKAVAQFTSVLKSREGDAPMWSGLPPSDIQKRVRSQNESILLELQSAFRALAA